MSELIVPLRYARSIWVASYMALFAGVVAASYNKYDLATVSWLGFGTSLNYWWYPVYGWRRNLDITTIQFCLWYHMYWAFYSNYWLYYYTITGLGCLLFIKGWNVSLKGDLLGGTLCHIGVHICANTANIILYTSQLT